MTDYFKKQELAKRFRKHGILPGKVTSKVHQTYNKKKSINVADAKNTLVSKFTGKIIKTNRDGIIRQLRDKYGKLNLTNDEKKRLAAIITDGKTAEQIRKEETILEKRKKGNIGWKRYQEDSAAQGGGVADKLINRRIQASDASTYYLQHRPPMFIYVRL